MKRTRTEIRVETLNEPFSHYTDAVQYGDLLYVSGCAPLDAEGNLVGTDAAEQARTVLENMGRILQAAGSSFEDILKVTVFLTDIDDRQAINSVREEFFRDAKPASTLVEVARLVVPGMRVEVEAIAAIPGSTT